MILVNLLQGALVFIIACSPVEEFLMVSNDIHSGLQRARGLASKPLRPNAITASIGRAMVQLPYTCSICRQCKLYKL